MSDVIASFLVSLGFAVNKPSQQAATRSMADYEQAVRKAEKAIEDARWAGAKTQEEVAKLTRELNLKLAKEALADAQAREKQEQEAAKKQKERAAQAAAQMRSLVNVATATAVAIQGFTVAMAGYATHVAARLEAMAYASDRTRSSIQDLKMFSQAVSQLGGTAGGALSDLENFAGRLRANPQGYTAFLKSVGVEARDAQGNIRGAAELYKEFRASVGRKPYEQQLLYMQEMGVSEETWRATDPAKLAAEEAAQRAKYARLGYNPDKAADDAKQLQHALRDMFDSINIIGEKTASKIFKDVGDNLKGFTTFIEQHGDEIAEILSKVAQLVLGLSKALLELATSDKAKAFLDGLLSAFGHVDEATGKWVADTDKIKDALEALAVFIATIFVAKITGAFASILKDLKPLLAILAPVLAALGIPILGTAAVGAVLGGLGDPSKSVNGTGGRPDGQLNPGDELPGVGGGTPSSGEGAWSRAKRLGRAALNAVGLGGGGGADSTPIPAGRFTALKTLIQSRESGAAGYNSVYGNGKYGWYSKPVTQSTVRELLEWQNKMRKQVGSSAFPVGRGQFIESTLRGLAQETGTMDEVLTPELQEKYFDRLIKRRGRNVAALRDEWEGLLGVDANRILNAYDTDGSAASPQSSTAKKPGWIDKDTYTDGLNIFRRGADGNLSRVTNIPGQPSTSSGLPSFAGSIARAGAGMNRLDMDKFRGIGAATQGFDPSQYLNAPPIGSSTSNDNSVKNQSYQGGTTHVTINTHGDARETAELWRRHGERSKADDLRYASSMFA
ncbi:hypothetical protein [Methylobacterium sp. SI9]|uniref:hypothetical protein n=1 Tax=Methylobacterium guangdongense TaxID=3138811 RepID=UPI00313B99D5